jgi:membrane fusion protein (multidrug efflux system)
MSSETSQAPAGNQKKKKALVIATLVIVLGLVSLYFYRGYAESHLKTDDAFVEASIHLVAARVPGTVLEVAAADNQDVAHGDVLVRLDPEPVEKIVAEAEAALRMEQGRLSEAKSRVKAQERKVSASKAALEGTEARKGQLTAGLAARQAEVQAKSAALDQAQLDLTRAEKLADQDVIPRSRYDQAKTGYEMSQASLAAAEELTRQAEAAITAHDAAVKQARAMVRAEKAVLTQVSTGVATQEEQVARRQVQLESSQLKLGYTEITAPAAGRITRKSVEVGNTVQPGQPLMSLVNFSEPYIVANYKETRIEGIAPGQEVVIRIDAYPGRKFAGKVDSIMAGTGSAFTLFPPENASGNYVKVVQRVPVKIVFDNPEEVRGLLRVGMSVVPTILIK